MKLITLDVETHYDDEGYTLKKMSTADYIFDPRFKALGISIKVGDKPARYFSHVAEILAVAKPEIEAAGVIAHNAQFDLLILSHHFNIRPKFVFCTLSMARGLGLREQVGGSLAALSKHFELGEKTELRPDSTPAELEARAVQDAELTWKLFGKMIKGYPPDELKLIDWTVRCFTEPTLHLDETRCQDMLDLLRKRKQAILDDLGVDATSLRSDLQFAELLRNLGIEPPRKNNPKGEQIYAFAKTDAAMQEMAECGDPEVEAVVSARLELRSTGDIARAERLLGAWRGGDRKGLPVYLSYSGAHTHRWAGGDKTNWQNFSKVRKDARNQIVAGTGEIRGSIVAPPGHVLVVGDASQVEARIVGWLAGEEAMVEGFRSGRDLYCELATDIFGRPITKADKVERFVGKTTVLGAGFGLGPPKFKDTVRRLGRIEIELATARKSVYAYREKFSKVPKLWGRAEHLLGNAGVTLGPLESEGDKVRLPNGMYLYYPELRKGENGEWSVLSRYGRRKTWGGAVTENCVQALARIIIAFQLLILREKYAVATMTHDELVLVVPESEVDYATEYMEKTMRYGPSWTYGYEGYQVSLPLSSEVGASRVYRDAKE